MIKVDLQETAGYNSGMTDKEVEDFYNELVEHYGEQLVNFEHYPKQFANQVRLYKYYKARKENESSTLQRPSS